MSSKVLIINPPVSGDRTVSKDAAGGFGTTDKGKGGAVYPPLSIAYTASVMRNKNVSVEVYDAHAFKHSFEEAIRTVEKRKDKFVGVLTSTATIAGDMSFAGNLKIQFPELKIIAFGPILRFFYENYLRQNKIDVAILSEPEYAFYEVCEALRNHRLNEVKGIAYLNKDGRLTVNPSRPYIEDLDSLPWPAWDLMPYKRYYPQFTVLSSRGCPFGCIYCPYAVAQGKKYRTRSPQAVIAEVKWLKKVFGANLIQFRDPLFGFFPERIKQMCKLLIESKARVKWICETRPEVLNDELIKWMKESNCWQVKLGVESANEQILRSLNRLKPSQIAEDYKDRVRNITRILRKRGIFIHLFFIIGFPDESWETIDETKKFISQLNPNLVQFSIATPYPGTPFYEIEKRGSYITENNLEKYGGHQAVVKTKYLSAGELETAVDDLNAYFQTLRLIKYAIKRVKINPLFIFKLPGVLIRKRKMVWRKVRSLWRVRS